MQLHIIQLKNGKWKGYFYFYEGTARKQKAFTSKMKTKLAAEKEIKNWYAAQQKQPIEANNIEKAVREYLKYQYARGLLQSSTYKQHLLILNNHITPHFGNLSYKKITSKEINSIMGKFYTPNTPTTTPAKTLLILKKTFRHLYMNEEIDSNPFDRVLPAPTSPAKVTHLTNQQLNNVLASLGKRKIGHPFRTALMLAIYTGMRRGEVCGLKWRDVHLEEGFLKVSSAIGVGVEGEYLKTPKTKSSARTIPIPKKLKEYLELLPREENKFVCTGRNEFYSVCAFGCAMRYFAQKNELVDYYGNRVTLHCLRHNYATIGVREGVDIGALSKIMGHANKSMTLDIYADTCGDAVVNAAQVIGDALG